MNPTKKRTINGGSWSIKFAIFEAVDLICYQVKKWIGAFAAALGGLETLVFSGGIGENAPIVRARICEGLGFLRIELEENQNATNEGLISTNASRIEKEILTDPHRNLEPTLMSGLILRALFIWNGRRSK